MRRIADRLELESGVCVLQPVYCSGMELTQAQLNALAVAHYKKIDISDGVYIANIGGYIGSSVAREIEYAKEHGKEIFFTSRLMRRGAQIYVSLSH